jgi:TonB family protein
MLLQRPAPYVWSAAAHTLVLATTLAAALSVIQRPPWPTLSGVVETDAPPINELRPLRAGSDVAVPANIVDVAPQYPEIALEAGVEGIVVLDATIDESGRVVDVTPLRSIAALDAAAIDAVRQRRYAPTIVNGAPVRVLLTVTVAFSLPK